MNANPPVRSSGLQLGLQYYAFYHENKLQCMLGCFARGVCGKLGSEQPWLQQFWPLNLPMLGCLWLEPESCCSWKGDAQASMMPMVWADASSRCWSSWSFSQSATRKPKQQGRALPLARSQLRRIASHIRCCQHKSLRRGLLSSSAWKRQTISFENLLRFNREAGWASIKKTQRRTPPGTLRETDPWKLVRYWFSKISSIPHVTEQRTRKSPQSRR